ncbi:MAG: SRPBCC domain-containing protein [Acidobacteriota bacterium]
MDDTVFKALADPSRRLLLDRLFAGDGQTLGELEGCLEMSRYGVMKHLRVLEAAGLVTTCKVGRCKYHYLNPVPIGRIQERWLSKYAAPWVGLMGGLKNSLEGTVSQKPKHVYEIYIRTSPEKLWQAITSGEMTQLYFHETRIESDWQVGSPMVYRGPDGQEMVVGEVLEIAAPQRLVVSWQFTAAHDEKRTSDPPSRVTWEIESVGKEEEVCRLTLVHDGFETETRTFQMVARGWVPILDSLKSLLETGRALPAVAV